ncbi:desumoylating isopeptidase 1 isoform X2 [Momordica charantia]|uniref:Desumoylating isopeptidase 1 isoform X2 n=1 Tax=Momordica charantia TaxID=3673 RepID=A0A6J1DPL9_MOMCH|nr:desumoylating isopeptidase 1 isoform X2 [Momordica charantia]
MDEESHRVVLNLYDLSRGLARQFSATLLGKPMEGIWHTGIVVYGNEYYYGAGIQQTLSGNTPFGTPICVMELGFTHVPEDVFEAYLIEISPRYTAETYSLLGHNCNNFSNEVAQFLVGSTIPDYILQLPNEVSNSPIGRLMFPKIPEVSSRQPTSSSASIPFLDSNVGELGGDGVGLNSTSLAVEPDAEAGQQKLAGKTVDETLLRDARAVIRDTISREFASIVVSGKFRAREAATLAARRVMNRYGNSNTSSSASQD